MCCPCSLSRSTKNVARPSAASYHWRFGTTKLWICIQFCVKILDNDHFHLCFCFLVGLPDTKRVICRSWVYPDHYGQSNFTLYFHYPMIPYITLPEALQSCTWGKGDVLLYTLPNLTLTNLCFWTSAQLSFCYTRDFSMHLAAISIFFRTFPLIMTSS